MFIFRFSFAYDVFASHYDVLNACLGHAVAISSPE
jgi:hypothetical protein